MKIFVSLYEGILKTVMQVFLFFYTFALQWFVDEIFQFDFFCFVR